MTEESQDTIFQTPDVAWDSSSQGSDTGSRHSSADSSAEPVRKSREEEEDGEIAALWCRYHGMAQASTRVRVTDADKKSYAQITAVLSSAADDAKFTPEEHVYAHQVAAMAVAGLAEHHRSCFGSMAAVALLIASEDRRGVSFKFTELLEMCEDGTTVDELTRFYRVVRAYVARFPFSATSIDCASVLRDAFWMPETCFLMIKFILEAAAETLDAFAFEPHVQAATATYLIRCFGRLPSAWDHNLECFTGLCEKDIQGCSEVILSSLRGLRASSSDVAIRYSRTICGDVSGYVLEHAAAM